MMDRQLAATAHLNQPTVLGRSRAPLDMYERIRLVGYESIRRLPGESGVGSLLAVFR